MSKFKVEDLKVGDILLKKSYTNPDRRIEYIVVNNVVGDVIYIYNKENGNGCHLFYEDVGDMMFLYENFILENQMYKVGDTVMLVKILDNEERGILTGKVLLRTKGVVSHVFKDCVSVDGCIWYFDEIKLVVRGEINES